MVINNMTDHECYAMLARSRIARLACARDNQPYIVPLNVDLKGDALYSYSTFGQKIEWMRQNPLVCLEVDEFTDEEQWASVVVFGYYQELPSTFGHAASRAIAQELFQRHPAWWEPATVPVDADEVRPPVVFRIQISRVSGRRAMPRATNVMNVPGSAPGLRKPAWPAGFLRRLAQRQ